MPNPYSSAIWNSFSVQIDKVLLNDGGDTLVLAEGDARPTVQQINSSLVRLSDQVRNVEECVPQMQAFVTRLEKNEEELQSFLRNNRERLEEIQRERERLQEYRDKNARRAHILGRISLYLESIPQLDSDSQLQSQIVELRSKVSALEEELSNITVDEQIQSALSIISREMSSWATEL